VGKDVPRPATFRDIYAELYRNCYKGVRVLHWLWSFGHTLPP